MDCTCSPWSHKESDTTERLSLSLFRKSSCLSWGNLSRRESPNWERIIDTREPTDSDIFQWPHKSLPISSDFAIHIMVTATLLRENGLLIFNFVWWLKVHIWKKKSNDQEYEHIINKWRNTNDYRIFEKPLTHVWFSIVRIILDTSPCPRNHPKASG